jgi:hypothetical protein
MPPHPPTHETPKAPVLVGPFCRGEGYRILVLADCQVLTDHLGFDARCSERDVEKHQGSDAVVRERHVQETDGFDLGILSI